ncbi:MAG: ABC transporter ATP-binding protein [Spirochaetia bacterium]|jgi:multiple sugar transport system ATP-binding protein
MASVELRNVWKYYGDVEAVIDTSWKCEDREFFSILGPSGCGKSSTLRMVAGLEEISKGDLFFDTRRVNDLHPRDRNVAMVFENWALYPTMNVYDNIAHPLRVRKMPTHVIDQKVREAAAFLNLTDILKHNVKKLSGGEMQRVSIGRAIVRDPAVLIMDEPISHLDASLRSRMRDELKTQISKLGVTTLYITHDQIEAMAMADRIAVMNEGRVQQIGKPLDIYNNPYNIFVAGFIGEPAMNFVTCERGLEGGAAVVKSPSFKITLEEGCGKRLSVYKGGSGLKLGVRPEDVKVGTKEAPGSFRAVVDFVEPQGDRTILSLKLTGGDMIFAQAFDHFRQSAGANVHVTFDQRHLHFFNPETGVNICYE